MSGIHILSNDGSISERVTHALSDVESQVSTLNPGAVTVGKIAASPGELLVLGADAVATLTADELETIAAACRANDIPVLLLGVADPSQKLVELGLALGDYLPLHAGEAEVSVRAKMLLRVKHRLDHLRAQAVIDELTGAYNRRYLDEQLSVRLGEARRYETPFSLILFDLDNFKNVNDTYGHPFGDVVLWGTAELVRRQMRKEDVLARYGGEEFAIMLPHTDRLGAAILAERVREASAEQVHRSQAQFATVTMSLGIASFPLDEAESVDKLIACADVRLYKAKEAGRNQSVFD